ncbi:MAG: hypothetical protein ACXWB9_08250, partial [Flavisolibacter sp.]
MKNIVLFIVIVAAISSCSEKSESEKKLPEQKAIPNDSKQIAQGTYTCWQYNQTSPGDMQALG